MIISVGCKVCRRETHILVPKGGYRMWARGLKSIHDAMPQLTPEDRDHIQKGICHRCAEKM